MKQSNKSQKQICQKLIYETEGDLKNWKNRLYSDNRKKWVQGKIRQCEKYINELKQDLEQLNG